MYNEFFVHSHKWCQWLIPHASIFRPLGPPESLQAFLFLINLIHIYLAVASMEPIFEE